MRISDPRSVPSVAPARSALSRRCAAVSVSESQRHQLYQRFEEAMGSEKAAVMMDLLPPVGWGDIATSDDVRHLGVELRGEMGELRGEMGELRGEMGVLRGEMGELRGEMGELRGERVRFEGRLEQGP